jgi:protein O-mannosyl-transferase
MCSLFRGIYVKRFLKVKYYIASGVALAAAIIYLPALQNEFVAWDDNVYIFANPHISPLNMGFFKWAFFDFYASNWHPLTWISHALDYAVWGLNPLGHHLTNIVFHAVNSFIVVLLIIKLLEVLKGRVQQNEPIPFLSERTILIAGGVTGLLFGLHPMHVESVAWVSERKDLLCALFFLLSVMQYTDYAKSVSDGSAMGGLLSRYYNKHYLLAAVFFILALLSKPMAVTLPVVLLILDWHPFERIQSFQTFRQAVVEKIPFLALSLFSSIITILAQRGGGAIRSTEVIPLPIRALVGAKALVAYLGKMLWPLDLVPYYPYPEHVSILSFEYLSAIALVVGITAVCIVLAKKQKLWLTVWGIYVVTLLPVLGIVQVGDQFMADRYMYLPSLGPFLIMGLTAAWISAKVNRLQRWRSAIRASVAGVAVLVFAALSFLTLTQIGIWKDSIDLWSYVIKKEPDRVPFAYINRGLAYGNKGLFQEAIEDLDKAVMLDPSYDLAYSYRGTVLGKMGLYAKAIEDFNKALVLEPDNYLVYNNLGIVYSKTGLYDKAAESFNEALAIQPDDAEIYLNRGLVYSLKDQDDRALADYNKALELKHDFATAYRNRGNLYQKNGRKNLALADFQKACELGDDVGCNALRQ